MHHTRELSDDELHMVASRTRQLMQNRFGIGASEMASAAANHVLTAMLRSCYIAVREQLEAERLLEGGDRPQ